MILKEYKVTKEQVLQYLYSLSWEQNLTLHTTFGKRCEELNLIMDDYVLKMIADGVFTFKGIPVKFK